MSFFRRPKSSQAANPSQPAETRAEIMQRRAREYIRTLQNSYPREYERLLSEVENDDLAQAQLTLRGLGSIVDEGYLEPVLQEMQEQVTAARLT
jgi:hypothetical protein